MPRILTVIGDLHFSASDRLKYASIIDGGRLFDKIAFMNHIRNRMLITDSRDLVIIGDLFDSNNPNEFIRKVVIDELIKFLNADISIYLCVGNHETDGETNCFESVGSLYNLVGGTNQFIGKLFIYRQEEISILPIGGHPTVVISGWDSDYSRLQEKLLSKGYNRKPLLLGHASLLGTSTTGKKFKFDGLSCEELSKKYNYGLFGHYHNFQEVYPNFTCLGSCVRVDHDNESKRYFAEIALDSHEDYKISFIEYLDREFVTILLPIGSEISKDTIKIPSAGAIIKVVVEVEEGKSISRSDNSKIRSIIREGGGYCSFIEPKVISVYSDINKIDISSLGGTSDLGGFLENVLKEYVKEYGGGKTIEDYGMKCLKGVLSD